MWLLHGVCPLCGFRFWPAGRLRNRLDLPFAGFTAFAFLQISPCDCGRCGARFPLRLITHPFPDSRVSPPYLHTSLNAGSRSSVGSRSVSWRRQFSAPGLTRAGVRNRQVVKERLAPGPCRLCSADVVKVSKLPICVNNKSKKTILW